MRRNTRDSWLPRFAYLDVDAEGRARLGGGGDELPESSARVAVRIRMRDGAPSVGPNAFFFQEGQADVFAGARWGELRVAADGTALLAGLRDEICSAWGRPGASACYEGEVGARSAMHLRPRSRGVTALRLALVFRLRGGPMAPKPSEPACGARP